MSGTRAGGTAGSRSSGGDGHAEHRGDEKDQVLWREEAKLVGVGFGSKDEEGSPKVEARVETLGVHGRIEDAGAWKEEEESRDSREDHIFLVDLRVELALK
ncbi:hypothetical protein OJ253_2924 [Cryptosporidium canis]|uniref:Uncharacterized protein n=1 Tax=Cryptosporidium canis TaxID=195482 RepID=A0A9D5DER8_9CRYT|nr:hypothetical protein OJ253_2924 [Cryptosporidium canis]